MINPLHPPDTHFLAAAEGWLGLNAPGEAAQELERIRPAMQTHPEVLRVRYHLYEKTSKWELAAETAQIICQIVPEIPFGWIHLAYALHELKRTTEAYNVLLPIVSKFPDEYIIRYNLACYCCQLGELDEARTWLTRSIALAGPEEIKKMASTDPDLRPLWDEILGI
ncbi:MAG TPA: tetratricopeptide repeat protein [Clostridia bacterium]|nr:tetratricopeptide repeat protein [Clostridia bacterium]